jgi:hypothetical protein
MTFERIVRRMGGSLAATLVLALPSYSIVDAQQSLRSDRALFAEAAGNAKLANEAFVRSDRLMMDWLSLADPRTGLLPRMATGPDRDIWNAKDCAADL